MKKYLYHAQAFRYGYLGNLVAVLFFSSAAPVILRAHNAPVGTLALFAILPLFWAMRAVIVPWLLRYIKIRSNPKNLLFFIVLIRIIIAIMFITLSVYFIFTSETAMIRMALLGAGMFACSLCGIERGLLDTGAVLITDPLGDPKCVHFARYEAAGIVGASTLANGMSIGLSAWLGLAACCFVIAILIIALTIPVWSASTAVCYDASDDTFRMTSQHAVFIWPHQKSCSNLIFLTLVFGWVGLDLAYRIVQPLMLNQGLSLGMVGIVTIIVGIILLLIFSTKQFLFKKEREKILPGQKILETWLPFGAVALLFVASITDLPAISIIGFVGLQISYYIFNIFATHIIILHGRISNSAASAVFLSGTSYFVAHVIVVPILAVTACGTKGPLKTCAVASVCVIISVLIRCFASRRWSVAF